ncbi:MAG: tetratricopeptide repeat protein [Acidobacteriota bacterium]|nr:tetratricopeptide repeat protein [Acidobacteriota bacterium]
MAELTGDARIRDLKRRLELDPGSRLFVTLAEEYRKSGLLAEALSTLQKGLLAHPTYLSAQVALGRAYLEAGQITEAIATFNKVLSNDPGNLVSAKSLADIYLSRGESVEAIKKYKLYRALSGDRTVDEIVERLQVELAPPPPPVRVTEPLPPPPTFFEEKPIGPIRTSRELRFDPQPRTRASEIGESTSSIAPLSFELDESTARRRPREPEPIGVLSRDNTPNHPQTSVLQSSSRQAPAALVAGAPSSWMAAPAGAREPPPIPAASMAGPQGLVAPHDPIANAEPLSPPPAEPEPERPDPWISPQALLSRPANEPEPAETGPAGEDAAVRGAEDPPAAADDVITRGFRLADIYPSLAGGNGQPEESPPPEAQDEGSGTAEDDDNGEPAGRTLADLYFAQGHYAEALDLYDELVLANPFDKELKRLRRDAEARLLPASGEDGGAEVDPALTRRLARVRALKRWLSVVQAG